MVAGQIAHLRQSAELQQTFTVSAVTESSREKISALGMRRPYTSSPRPMSSATAAAPRKTSMVRICNHSHCIAPWMPPWNRNCIILA